MNDEVIYLFDIVILSFLAIFEIFTKREISKYFLYFSKTSEAQFL